MVANKKFLPQPVFAHFVGMLSDNTLHRVFVPEKNSVITCRCLDFENLNYLPFFNIFTLPDGISGQKEVEQQELNQNEE